MDKYSIINLKLKGYSNMKVSKILGLNKKTISKYWNEHLQKQNELNKSEYPNRDIQQEIIEVPKYNTSKRVAIKYTEEIDNRLEEIIASEIQKNKKLGSHKQKLTKKQIHKILKDEGYNISYPTISTRMKEKNINLNECYIKQNYDYGDRLEYDFGEVKLEIDGEIKKYYLAVLSSPASNFRWAFIYDNQKKDVFLDSHVRFFEMVKGTYREVVYDNMRNVVTKFIGRNEKQLNETLLQMAMYYEFSINVTNCYRGNEKGHVEGSVKVIRNEVFAMKYNFSNIQEVEKYLEDKLIELNGRSSIKEELEYLNPYKPKLEIAAISKNNVNKYSFIQLDNNCYSVPEYMVNKEVTVKLYYDKVYIYSNNNLVCEHKRLTGKGNISTDIKHYLKSMKFKPGSVKNSLALKSIPELKNIFENDFNNNPKKFIELLIENKEKSINEIIKILNNYVVFTNKIIPISNIYSDENVSNATKNQMFKYDELCIRGDH